MNNTQPPENNNLLVLPNTTNHGTKSVPTNTKKTASHALRNLREQGDNNLASDLSQHKDRAHKHKYTKRICDSSGSACTFCTNAAQVTTSFAQQTTSLFPQSTKYNEPLVLGTGKSLLLAVLCNLYTQKQKSGAANGLCTPLYNLVGKFSQQ